MWIAEAGHKVLIRLMQPPPGEGWPSEPGSVLMPMALVTAGTGTSLDRVALLQQKTKEQPNA
jgi:hypothetical protein